MRDATLQLIPSELLRPGFCLPGALCDKTGSVLVGAGVELTEDHITKLGPRVITGLYGGGDWPADILEKQVKPSSDDEEDAPDSVPAQPDTQADDHTDLTASGRNAISVETLRIGTRISQNIYDQQGILLLVAGSKITSRFLHLLLQRQIKIVQLGFAPSSKPRDIKDEQKIEQLDELLTHELKTPVILRPGQAKSRPRLPLKDLYGEAQRGLDKHTETSSVLAGVCEALESGQYISGDKLRGVVSEFGNMLTLDSDLLVTITSMQKSLGEYLFDHCVNVSLLSMTIATQLGMSQEQILEIGLGAIFQDAGMLRVDESIRLAPRVLTPSEWIDIERHPIHTLDYLEGLRGLPPLTKLIGYQVHERGDQTGYPRQRSAVGIHPYARIVAVADAYAAMSRPRPHRLARSPHDAVRELLVAANSNKFDRTIVRSFLDCVSAFPVGSLVVLNDGLYAKVIRANPGHHTRPVIAEVDLDGNPTDRVIDLSKETHLEVVKSLQAPENEPIKT